MIFFEHLFWSHKDTRHHVLSHYLTCSWFICWKINTRIIRFFVWTCFLSAVAAVIVKSKYIQTFQKQFFFLTFSLEFHTHTKTIGRKAALSHKIYKAKEAPLCIQRKSDQERKGVLCLKLTVTCWHVTRQHSSHLWYLHISNPARLIIHLTRFLKRHFVEEKWRREIAFRKGLQTEIPNTILGGIGGCG